jgi:intracellular multiplication protein IcmK
MRRLFRNQLLVILAVALATPALAEPGLEGLLLTAQPQAQPAQGQGGRQVPNPFTQPGGQGGAQVQNQLQTGVQIAPGVQQVPVPGGAKPPMTQADRDRSFQKALQDAMPMTPDQIREYRKRLDEGRRATVAPLSPAAPRTRQIAMTLKPGEETPSLYVRPGTVSTMTFSDITGRPWPVMSVVTGNPTAYVAQSAGEEGKSNIIVVSPVQEHIVSNLVVTLVGHPVPVTLVLDPDQAATDYRLDVRIASRGPNAAIDIVGVSSLTATNDMTMVKFLDGVAPNGARRMNTTSTDVEAWRFEDLLYVRTTGDVLSPSYTGRSQNVSGVNVFVMADTPVVLLSKDGRVTSIHVNR